MMKKTSRTQIEREIISRVKREMNRPRLTESVRNGLSVKAAPAVESTRRTSASAVGQVATR
jgi:hypothetical protein